MERSAVEAYCRSLPGVTDDVKWESSLVFSVGKKMFAAMSATNPTGISFKADPELFYGLTEVDGIDPAPYLARHKWVKLQHLDVLDDKTLKNLLTEAHRLVFEKLSGKLKKQIMEDSEGL